MINEDRFWESAISEAVRTEPPPDVTARVLASLADAPARPAPAPRRKLRVLRILGELAVAAAVVFAIGWLTGVFRVPVEETPVEPTNVAAAPGADYEFNDGVITLRGGWLLVATGAPDVRSGESVLSGVDGRVLIHASGVPARGQAEAVAGWLNANGLEIEMIGEAKSWAKGVTLAALVLSGSAMLDGQKIEGPQPAPVATTEWHVVRSVMDIDNLPKDARYVSADLLDAAHLDFLAEVPQLEGIRFTNATDLRPDHLRSLKALKNLRWLDLRAAIWSSDVEPDYEPLKELPALKRVSLDHNVGYSRQGDGPQMVLDFATVTMPTLAHLSDKGVEIELGNWDPPTALDLEDLLRELPTVRKLSIYYATAAEMKLLAGHAALRSLELRYPQAGEIGLAYLARKGALEELAIEDEFSLDDIHQISRMNLRTLKLDGTLADSPQECFERIAGMKSLRELELGSMEIPEEGLLALKAFAGMQRLDVVRIRGYVASGFELWVAHRIPTRRLELQLEGPPRIQLGQVPDELTDGEAGKLLEELRFEFWGGAGFDPDWMDDQHAAAYKSYPNLKRIEVRRGGFEVPTQQDQFVAWLKKIMPNVDVVVAP